MNKHTPGPWHCVEDHGRGWMKYNINPHNGYCLTTIKTRNGQDWQRAQADARLIAAAPELLEACTAVDTFFVFFDSIIPPGGDFGSGAREALRLAHVAIAKAKGGQP